MNKPTIERLMKFSREAAEAKRTAVGGLDQRIVRRWDITTSKEGKTLTTTVECTRLTASLYADRMTQRGECHLVSITPNVKAVPTEGGEK